MTVQAIEMTINELPARERSPAGIRAQSAHGRRLRILSVSSLLPSHGQPQSGIFVQRRLHALAEHADVEVIRPIPSFPRYGHRGPDARTLSNGLSVRDQSMFYLPLVLKHLDSMWLQRAIEPLIHHAHQVAPIDLIDAHFGFPTGVGCVNAARRLGIPVFVTLRGVEQEEIRHRRIGPQIVRALAECAGVIAVGPSLKEAVVRAGVPERQVRVIPNAVDRNRFRPGSRAEAREQLGVPSEAELIVSVGSLCRVKRHHVLIDAFREIRAKRPNARLAIIGGKVHERRYPAQLSRRILRYNLAESVTMAGAVGPADVQRWLHAANVFTLASAREGSCNAVLEALACGVPVVTTPVADHPSLIDPPRRGMVVPVDDAASLAGALCQALDRMWDACEISRSGQARSWDDVACETIEFFQERTAISQRDESIGESMKEDTRES